MRTITLVSLGLGGVGTVAGTGVALSYYYGGSTIKEYIEANKKENNKVFLTLSTPKLNDIKLKYKELKRVKPKVNGKEVSETEIAQGCEKAVENKFSNDKDTNFEAILSGCYINTKTFEEELVGKSKTKIASTKHTEVAGQNAWTKYSTTKDNSCLKITGHSKDNILNGTNAQQGQEELMKGCQTKATLGMYADEAKEDFPRFAHGCTN